MNFTVYLWKSSIAGLIRFSLFCVKSLLRSLSEAAAEGGSVAMAERIFANAYMVLGVGAKIMFYIVANFSATIKAKWISLEWSFAG